MNRNAKIPSYILKELCSRFAKSVPESERTENIIKLCYHVEKLHWFYLDNFCPKNYRLPKLTFETFCDQLFPHVELQNHLPNLTVILRQFRM